ncbi:hypothetical protein TPHA_0G03030 [Tetrapisispora phaffii CBS 4417]|uniref:ATPase synthesis protein 25 n=1 Tax=Tetrapisispora phaffii (strain ATCC 24235 / CBS 4417 / NBRC 1672 / NRRL Y-8282 / UCD 70-5) TaxID=1071381 RepID=G8BW66_TETPH|nr:hypothetical protein TPHA_0G03030 [Tetrapisispora phaffii CBS 4417]CCE64144.1 hypothetical protein TPHA_0G03030 [Tetrapisispora phaffii CBS 4417]
MLRARKLSRGPAVAICNKVIYNTTKLTISRHQSTAEPPIEKEKRNVLVPWYVSMVNREKLLQQQTPVMDQIVEFPEHSPHSLIRITNFIKNKLGITDIKIFDLKQQKLSEPHEREFTTAVAEICDYMVIGTGKSSKHCNSTFIELNKVLKSEYNTIASVEGNINANDERKRKRRLEKKNNYSKALGNTLLSSSNKESWYMIDCNVDNIFVSILTPNKRTIMKLEELYLPASHESPVNEDLNEITNENPLDTQPGSMMDVNDGNNVLAGLKRLALQNKRNYSTVSQACATENKIKHILRQVDENNLRTMSSDLIKILNIPQDNQIIILEFINKTLESMIKTSKDNLNIGSLKLFFDYHWPISMEPTKSIKYWEKRQSFLYLLNEIDPVNYGPKQYYCDYLVTKVVSNSDITTFDFESFLKLTIRSIERIEDPKYSDLVKYNHYLVKSLKLIRNYLILDNGETISLLLNTMIIKNKNKNTNLNALYEVIDYLVSISSERKVMLDKSIVIPIINTLAEVNSWYSIWKIWDQLGYMSSYKNDTRPWYDLINLVIKKGDKSVHEHFINSDMLMWIKRNDVLVDDKLGSAITELFQLVNNENFGNADLKKYLLSHNE